MPRHPTAIVARAIHCEAAAAAAAAFLGAAVHTPSRSHSHAPSQCVCQSVLEAAFHTALKPALTPALDTALGKALEAALESTPSLCMRSLCLDQVREQRGLLRSHCRRPVRPVTVSGSCRRKSTEASKLSRH
eukprot:4223228-Pleurochrysis_carterae.AAC.1